MFLEQEQGFNPTGSLKRWFISSRLRKQYAGQLVRNYALDTNTVDGWNDAARVSNSRYLINQGIEPTEENLIKLQEEVKQNPPAPVPISAKGDGFTASNEEILRECEAIEIERICNEQRLDFFPNDLIDRVCDRINAEWRSDKYGLRGVYILGYIYGVRAERKRRRQKRCSTKQL